MEHEQDSAGRTRGQSQLHIVPEDWQSAAAIIEPLLDRLEADSPGPQLLVVASDAEAAASIAAHIAPRVRERGLGTLAATSAARAKRALRPAPAHVITATPTIALALLESAALKLDGIRAVVLGWVDELGASPTRALETLMAEVPKDAIRVVAADAVTPNVEQLVERYARRARRVMPAVTESLSPVSMSYVLVSEPSRALTLRRILDALDPESAHVVVRDAEARRAVEVQLQSLGHGADSTVHTGAEPDANALVVVLFDLPANDTELRRFAGNRPASRVIAMATPRQLATLRRWAGGTVTPLTLPEPVARARASEERLRDELRSVLQDGQFSRELVSLEPLLADYDGAEIAAAALRLLEASRVRPSPTAAPVAAQFTRLYVNVGAMDNVRPADLVGAITGETGVAKTDLGNIDVRDRFSTVEVAPAVAETVVSRLTGVSMKGRRVVARVDEGPERPARPRRDSLGGGSRGGRGPSRGPSRDPRGGFRDR